MTTKTKNTKIPPGGNKPTKSKKQTEPEILPPDREQQRKPTEYSKEAADRILQRIMDGEMLIAVCREEGMPTREAFYRWMLSRDDLKQAYARARLAWADYWAEKVMEVSFDDAGDIFIEEGKAVADHARIQRDRLKVDSVKWLVGKYAPRTYGDKPAVDGETEPKQLTVSWQRVDRVIEPHGAEKPPPRQIAYQPTPPPADLSPEAWSAIVRVSELIESIAPSDETPEQVFGLIEGFLRSRFVAGRS